MIYLETERVEGERRRELGKKELGWGDVAKIEI